MKEQQELGIKDVSRRGAEARSVADYKFEPIRGQPMLRWAGKRPFTSTQYFPAQEKERHGDEVNGWMNEIYWGDNIQVMSHLLKKYRGKIQDRVDIDERPKTVENRARVGHWEGDLINGLCGTGNLVTLAERMTRFTLVAYAATKESPCVMSAIIGMLASLPKGMLKTCTFDNGKECALFRQLEQALGIKVYFAKPYHSWERGANENRNGIVRKVLPKGSSFDAILDEELRRIDYMLNDRPMRCLDWRTPREAFSSLLRRYIVAA